ncbi:hypothetical protein LXL04_002541 [Taraxacum kok-saghyz]
MNLTNKNESVGKDPNFLYNVSAVYCDNVSAVYFSSNTVQHQQTKHVEIDIHFVREKVALGHFRVLHVPSSSQYVDICTKGLPSSLFLDFRASLNIRLLYFYVKALFDEQDMRRIPLRGEAPASLFFFAKTTKPGTLVPPFFSFHAAAKPDVCSNIQRLQFLQPLPRPRRQSRFPPSDGSPARQSLPPF